MLIFDKKRESYQIVGYKQFDSTDPIIAQFLNDGEPINLSEYNVRFECKKPDGNIVIQDEDIIIKDLCEVEIYLDEQVTVINGLVKCQFVLVHKVNKTQNTTFTFDMDIQQSVIGIKGYSRSLVTVAERLNKDVITGQKLHKDLTNDIAVGNQVKDTLVDKTNVANTTIETLIRNSGVI